ncbi:MAG: hypothetical protein ACJ780_15960 [Solirubrobacteraceae bacterium]
MSKQVTGSERVKLAGVLLAIGDIINGIAQIGRAKVFAWQARASAAPVLARRRMRPPT